MITPLAKLITLPATTLYALLFPIAVIEGPIITVISGFFGANQIINIYIAYFIMVAGDITGDCLYYALGRFGGRRFFDRWGHLLGISASKVSSMESHYRKHSGKTILISKITHGIGPVFLVAAGASRVPFKRFIAYSSLGSFPITLILLLIGYFFGQAYMSISLYLDWFGYAASGIAILLFIGYRLMVLFAKKYEEKI
ncbi:DedA family protein [Candidatus Falkowbacteria bacterium]|nr:DedA family protein [Candidatus Falkowbacteria bacterium]